MWLALFPGAFASPPPAPPPRPPDARFALALYCSPTCSEDVFDVLDTGLAGIDARDGFPERADVPMRIMGLAGAEFGIPDADFVAAYGVEVDRPEELARSEQVLLAWFAGPRESAAETFAVARAAFAAAAEASGGWVEDLDTQRIYGRAAWRATDPRGPVTDWFVIEAGDAGAGGAGAGATDGAVRLVTRGLRRYGDFELIVEDVPPDVAADVSFVVNALATVLHGLDAIDAQMAIDTGAVKGTATFSRAAGREDDPEDPLLRASFDGDVTSPGEPEPAAPANAAPSAAPSAEPAPLEGSAAGPAVTSGAGAPPRPPAPLPASSLPASSLKEAQERARARLEAVVHPAWIAGLAPGAAVAVYAPFQTRAGLTEYMWIELRSWSGADMTGTLMNDPYDVEGLRRGDTVALSQGEVFDYIWKKGDGTREGNTTNAFVRSAGR